MWHTQVISTKFLFYNFMRWEPSINTLYFLQRRGRCHKLWKNWYCQLWTGPFSFRWSLLNSSSHCMVLISRVSVQISNMNLEWQVLAMAVLRLGKALELKSWRLKVSLSICNPLKNGVVHCVRVEKTSQVIAKSGQSSDKPQKLKQLIYKQ